MLSIRFDSNESTRIVSLGVDSLYRKSICEILSKYSVPGLYRVGWKCCRFDSIRTSRHESFPLVSIRYTGSRFARYLENIASRVYTWWVENVVESTRIASPAVDSLYRKSICEILKYSFPGLYRVGWKFCRFDSIRSNRHESLPLLSNRYAGSRFARDLENIASRVCTGWVENVVEWTRIASPPVDSLCRKSICASLRKYSVPGLYRVVWKCCRFDSIRANRHESFPLLSIRYTGSRFARYLANIAFRVYTGWAENVVDSIRFERIDTNRFPCCRFVIPEVDLRDT